VHYDVRIFLSTSALLDKARFYFVKRSASFDFHNSGLWESPSRFEKRRGNLIGIELQGGEDP